MNFLTSLPLKAEDTIEIVVTEVIGHNLCIASTVRSVPVLHVRTWNSELHRE